MQLRPEPDVFETTSPLDEIMRFSRLVTSGRHKWIVNPTQLEAFDAYVDANLAPPRASTLKTLGRDAFTQTAYAATSSPVTPIDRASLSAILADLDRAAVLVVEDLRSDGEFVISLARIFGRAQLVSAFENGWIEIRHGGGSGITGIARAEAQRFNTIVRVLVLFDSDRLVPGSPAKCSLAAAAVRSDGAVVHVLAMREAENYLPNAVLAAAVQRPARTRAVVSRRIAALKRLSADQRAHYDMKKGFGLRDGQPVVLADQEALFEDVSEPDKRALIGGFGDSVLSRLQTVELRLRRRDFEGLGENVSAEIDALLDTIAAAV